MLSAQQVWLDVVILDRWYIFLISEFNMIGLVGWTPFPQLYFCLTGVRLEEKCFSDMQ